MYRWVCGDMFGCFIVYIWSCSDCKCYLVFYIFLMIRIYSLKLNYYLYYFVSDVVICWFFVFDYVNVEGFMFLVE